MTARAAALRRLPRHVYRYTANELSAMPTLCIGQADNLKLEVDGRRWWLSRCGKADGERYERTVTIEMRTGTNAWITAATYDGDRV